MEHRLLEVKAAAMSWVANRLFSTREQGIDGFLKRSFLKKPAAARDGLVLKSESSPRSRR